jgi:hypothetical protein
MRLLVNISCIMVLSFLLCSCSVRHGNFTVLSNKLIDTQNFDLNNTNKDTVVGKKVRHIVVFVPTSRLPTLKGALDDAFDQSSGDVLTDAVISSWNFIVPLLYGQSGWKVEGTAVKTHE